MVMVGVPSLELECVEHRKSMRNCLNDIPTIELEQLVRSLDKQYYNKKVDFGLLAFQPNHDFFLYSGAVDVLRERNGQDYVDKLLNLRRARTFREKLSSLLFGTTFTYDS
jgi:hypothetical protein